MGNQFHGFTHIIAQAIRFLCTDNGESNVRGLHTSLQGLPCRKLSAYTEAEM